MKTVVHVQLHDDVLDGVIDILGDGARMGHIDLWVNRACREQLKREREWRQAKLDMETPQDRRG
jgi:hypothetical protein